MSSGRGSETAQAIIDRLNAEKKAWSFEIVTHVVLENEVIVLGRLTVDGSIRMAFGSASLSVEGSRKPGSASAELMSAANEALSRAARLFGVAIVLEQRADSPCDAVHGHCAPDPENRITQKQLGALNGVARRRNLGRTEFAEMLRARFGRGDLISLTKREASDLLTELSGMNGHASI